MRIADVDGGIFAWQEPPHCGHSEDSSTDARGRASNGKWRGVPHSTAGDLREANRSGRGPEKIREARSGLLRFCLQPSDVVRQRVAAVGSNKVVHGQLLRAAHDGEGRVRVGVGYEAIIGGVGDAVAVDD